MLHVSIWLHAHVHVVKSVCWIIKQWHRVQHDLSIRRLLSALRLGNGRSPDGQAQPAGEM